MKISIDICLFIGRKSPVKSKTSRTQDILRNKKPNCTGYGYMYRYISKAKYTGCGYTASDRYRVLVRIRVYAYISKVKYIRCRYTASDGYKAKYIKIHRTQTMDIAIYLDNISKYYMQVTV